jgi:ATP-dependent DNA helicase RecQ
MREAIAAALEGRDTLVVTSAGSGKSAVHEIAGLVKPGVTIVINPHVAEQLANAEVLDSVRAAGPSLIVVEDAHCMCASGPDFRPEYLRLGSFIAEMGHPTTLALTASASPAVRDEIVEKLHLHDPCVIVQEESAERLDMSAGSGSR